MALFRSVHLNTHSWNMTWYEPEIKIITKHVCQWLYYSMKMSSLLDGAFWTTSTSLNLRIDRSWVPYIDTSFLHEGHIKGLDLNIRSNFSYHALLLPVSSSLVLLIIIPPLSVPLFAPTYLPHKRACFMCFCLFASCTCMFPYSADQELRKKYCILALQGKHRVIVNPVLH